MCMYTFIDIAALYSDVYVCKNDFDCVGSFWGVIQTSYDAFIFYKYLDANRILIKYHFPIFL